MSKVVYIVSTVDLEPWEDYCSGPARAFSTLEKAEEFLESVKDKTFDEEDNNPGYCFSEYIGQLELDGGEWIE